MNIAKFVITTVLVAAIVCTLIVVAMTVVQSVTDVLTNDSAQALTRRARFGSLARIRGFHTYAVEEETSAGYASVETLARFFGLEELPEPERGREHWTNREFQDELRRVFPDYYVTRRSNLSNTELVDVIFTSLEAGNPVIIFHAAESRNQDGDGGALEKRYSVVIGVDLPNDRITLGSPQGTFARYTLDEFIRSSRFDNYATSFFQRLLFAFRIYSKNTVFIVDRGEQAVADY